VGVATGAPLSPPPHPISARLEAVEIERLKKRTLRFM
jgi:hypothetical protein